MAEPAATPNVVVRILRDLRDALELTGALVGDDAAAREVFGRPLGGGPLAAIGLSAKALDTLAAGDADLTKYQEVAARLAEAAQALRLAAQAGSGAGAAEELVGAVVDAVSVSYVAGGAPWLLFTGRALRFVDDEIHLGRVGEFVGDTGGYIDRMFGPLDTEDDARHWSALLAILGVALAYFVKSPRFRLDVLHGWETDPDTQTPRADLVSERLVTIRLRFEPKGTSPADQVKVDLLTTLAFVPREHGGPGLWLSLGWGGSFDHALGRGWHFVSKVTTDDAVDLFLPMPGRDAAHGAKLDLGAGVGGSVELRVERRDEGGQTPADPSRPSPGGVTPAAPYRLGPLEVRAAELSLRLATEEPPLQLRLGLRGAALTIPSPGKGLLGKILPANGLRLAFDVALLATNEPAVRFEGGTGLEVVIPIGRRLGPVHAVHVLLALRVDADGKPTFEASAGLALTAGPFSLVVDRVGVMVPEAPHGIPAVPWLKLPSAIGIGLDGPVVHGGGFLFYEPERGRYGGMLQLTIDRFSLVVFGLYQDQARGYSLILVGSLEFAPPLPLLFGIGLSGLGFISGHNHGINVSALQEGLRGGAVGALLFPRDVVAAAPQILTTLSNVFPPMEGQSLLGLMLKLTWAGGLVSISAALVFESGPQADRVVLLGRLEMAAPSRDLGIVVLKADFAGVFDQTRPAIDFDAALVDSRVGPFVLTGDVTLRFRGGDNGVFLLAAGGFHPGYTPPADLALPPQRRLTIATPSANPRLRIEKYWAVTSNSIQTGAKLEVVASAGGFSAEALLSYDAIVHLDPLRLLVDIEGRAAIKYDGSTLAGVRLVLHLEGPSPWHLWGKATLSLFFFSVSVPIDTTFGDDAPEEPAPLADAVALVQRAFAEPTSWDAMPSAARLLATVRPAERPGRVLAHPLGRLTVRQSALPLGIEITRVGRARVAKNRFDVQAVTIGGAEVAGREDLRAPFAAGQFLDLDDDARLSRPDFEPFVAGFAATPAADVHGPATPADLTFEEIVIGPDGPLAEPEPDRPPLVLTVLFGAAFGAAGASRLRRDERVERRRAAAPVAVRDLGAVLADAATLTPAALGGALAGRLTVTEATQALAELAVGSPARAGGLLVLGAHETRTPGR
jgi:hypothetical protein